MLSVLRVYYQVQLLVADLMRFALGDFGGKFLKLLRTKKLRFKGKTPFLIHYAARRRHDSKPLFLFDSLIAHLANALRRSFPGNLCISSPKPSTENDFRFKSSAINGEKSMRAQIEACTFCLFCASNRWLCIPTSHVLRFSFGKNLGKVASQRTNPGWIRKCHKERRLEVAT